MACGATRSWPRPAANIVDDLRDLTAEHLEKTFDAMHRPSRRAVLPAAHNEDHGDSLGEEEIGARVIARLSQGVTRSSPRSPQPEPRTRRRCSCRLRRR